jgi:hypothetical protein
MSLVPETPHPAVPPSDAAPSITGTVVGDDGEAEVVAAPSALHPDEADTTDALASITGVEMDDADDGTDDDAVPDDDALPPIDIVSE